MDTRTIPLEIIELDFDLKCESKAGGGCSKPADYLTEHRCPACGYHAEGAEWLVCRGHWERRSRNMKTCRKCQHRHPHGDAWRIIAVL